MESDHPAVNLLLLPYGIPPDSILALLLDTVLARANEPGASPADLILHNGRSWTVDERKPVARFVLLIGAIVRKRSFAAINSEPDK